MAAELAEGIVSLIGISMFLFSIAAVMLVTSVLLGTLRKSSLGYRRYLADMYISGRIRQFAEADKVDLVKEDDSFREYLKKLPRGDSKSVDKKIEEELNAKIDAEIEKKQQANKKA